MTTANADSPADRSLRAAARWVGGLNLLSAVPDGFAVSTMQKLFVRNDAAATAANVLRSESLFRLSLVADLFALVIFAGAAVLMYQVFRPAGRRGAMFFLVLMVLGIAFQSLACIQDFTGLLLLKGVPGVPPPAEAKTLAFVFFRMHSYDYQLALLFYGCSSVTVGFLLLRARFLPRFLAPCMWLDGLGYIAFVLTSFLAPLSLRHIYPWLPFGTTLGEAALFFWLIFRSVDVAQWRKQAAETAAEGWA